MSRRNYDPVRSAREAGDLILAAGAAVALCVALFNYFKPHNGIDGSWGALLVVASTGVVLLASFALALLVEKPSWRRVLLSGAILVGLTGTVAAAYFIESVALVVAMAVAFVGWTIRLYFAPNASDFALRQRGLAR